MSDDWKVAATLPRHADGAMRIVNRNDIPLVVYDNEGVRRAVIAPGKSVMFTARLRRWWRVPKWVRWLRGN